MKKQYYTEAELKKLFTNLRRKSFTDVLANILISHTYNRPVNMRTSGFYFPGNPDATLTWNNSTRTVRLMPVNPGEDVYDKKGNLYVPNFRFYVWEQEAIQQRREQEETLQIPAEEGLFLVHFAVNQETRRYELSYIKNPEVEDIAGIYLQGVPVCWIYWDATAGEAIYFGDSRHGSQWNPQIHWVWHQTLNSRRESGLKITGAVFDGAGDANEDFQFGISGGKLWHEDIFWETDAVTALQSLPVWFFDSAGDPRFAIAAGQKFLNTGTGRVAYNPAGGNLEEITDGQFALYHLFATNCKINPVISVMGTDDFPGIGEAVSAVEAEVATLRQKLPHSNLMHIGSFILQTSDTYTNSAKARIVWASNDVDTFTTELIFNEVTRELTLKQNNDKPDLVVTIPGGDGSGTPGEDGITPHIGANGNWYIGETDTGVAATGPAGADGDDGITPHIGANGNWYIDTTDTGIPATGPQGPAGADGADGTSVLILGSVPTSTNLPGYPGSYTGNIGDGYITSDTGHLWVWNGSAWVDAGNITGPAGAAGADGSKWYVGSTTPGSETGKIGDFYLRTTNGDIYEKTGASTWTYRANITGPAGADGEDGTNGTDGADGAVWHTGTTTPGSATGKIGDFYLRTTHGDIYEKTGVTTWTYRANIMGPAGPPGADGEDGDTMWIVDANGIHYSAGNVGIGTDSDSANALKVAKNVSATYVASFTNSNGTNGAGVLINVSNNNPDSYALNILSNTGALFNIANNGKVRFSKYGSGSISGTAVKWLAVDSSGNLIEVDAPVTGGSSPWTDAGSYLYPTDGERVQIGYSGANNYAKLYVDGDIATGVGKFLGFNAYYNSGWKHVGSGHATFVKQESTDFTFYVSDTIRSAGQTVTFNSIKFQNSTGNVIANDFVHTSMRKLKKWIKDIINPERFDKIKIQQFVFRKDKSKRVRYGVIAEDVEKIAPELVITDEKGDKTVSYIDLALAKITRLEQRIKELEESKNGN